MNLFDLNIDKTEYNYALPYPHCAIDNILLTDFALECQNEILKIHPDEWDMYNNPFEKKYTLRNKDKLPPNVSKLFEHLNTPSFIDKLSDIMGEKIYCDKSKNWYGVHVYDKDGFLDIHLDAGIHYQTGQKKHCTLLIYLSKDWSSKNNGDLELWSGDNVTVDNPKISECVVKIEPSFNKLVLFTCTDNSWHGASDNVKCFGDEKRIVVTVSYVSDKHDSEFQNNYKKAYFVKKPDEVDDLAKDRFRMMRLDPIKCKEIYNINDSI